MCDKGRLVKVRARRRQLLSSYLQSVVSGSQRDHKYVVSMRGIVGYLRKTLGRARLSGWWCC